MDECKSLPTGPVAADQRTRHGVPLRRLRSGRPGRRLHGTAGSRCLIIAHQHTTAAATAMLAASQGLTSSSSPGMTKRIKVLRAKQSKAKHGPITGSDRFLDQPVIDSKTGCVSQARRNRLQVPALKVIYGQALAHGVELGRRRVRGQVGDRGVDHAVQGKGLRSSTFRLNGSTFCWIPWVHDFPPVY